MKSRERILAAVSHREPDRIPIDFNGHRSSGIMVQAYVKLRKYLGLQPSKLYVYDFIQQLALVEDDVLDLVGADVVELGHNYSRKDQYWKDWELEDGTPCKIPAFINVEKTKSGNIVRNEDGIVICEQRNGCYFFEQTYFPLLNNNDDEFKDISKHLQGVMWCELGIPPAPAKIDSIGLMEFADAAKEMRSSTDRAIYATFGGNLIEIGEFCFRIDNFLYLLAADPLRMHKYLDSLVEHHLSNLEKYLRAVGDSIDIIGFGDDMGTQTGPQFSPRMYREFFKHRHSVLYKKVKELAPNVKVSLHSCGGIYPLIGDLIEAGVDILNPVQFTCRDMELSRLKRDFGDDLTFWGGGCDTRAVLSRGTPDEVRKHVKENIEIMCRGGGYVFQQVHNVLAEVPPENIVAMFETVNPEMRNR